MPSAPRWLFHVVRATEVSWGSGGRYAPPSLAREGFVHTSFHDRVLESARLYFAGTPGEDLRVLAIDPRRLDVPVEIAETPRGPMPHVRGSIPADAVSLLPIEDVPVHADRVLHTHVALLAFEGMTLLDLVGPLDALRRIATMGYQRGFRCEVVALTRPEGDDTLLQVPVYAEDGLVVTVDRYRPSLEDFDVVVVPGGPGARALAEEPEVAAYLATFPPNRLLASVCTGALIVGASGRLRGRRATTHAKHLEALVPHGAEVVRERVVDDGQLVTAGGVTAGIDLGLHLVRRLAGDEAAEAIAAQMEARLPA